MRTTSILYALGAITFLFASAPAKAVFFEQVTTVSVNQPAGPVVTGAGAGFNHWETTLEFTNTGTEDLNEVVWVSHFASARVGSGPPVVLPWENGAQNWSISDRSVAPDNHIGFLLLDPSVTDLSAIGSGVSPGDSLPIFTIGDLDMGQTVTVEINYILTNNINTFFFNGRYAQQINVPEPVTLGLLALGLLATGARGRSQT